MNILIADDEKSMRFMLRELLTKDGHTVKEAEDGYEAVALVERESFDVAILDLRMPRLGGCEAIDRIRQIRPDMPILVITAHGSPKIGQEAIAAGAFDYFTKPFDNDELRIVIKRAAERRNLQTQVESLRRENERLRGSRELVIGESPVMKDVNTLIRQVAPSDVTLLILGESGTGKELVAQAVVNQSSRRDKPFIKVNCAAIPETLLESELFGHEKGAFTGAIQTKPGKFEVADKGTLFLDEVGDLSLGLQAKLLRVLQEREFEHVGGTKPIHVDVRIIAATNTDLTQKVKDKQFREDLFFRLNVVPITLPPLRERGEDYLRLLVVHFISLYSQVFGKTVTAVCDEVWEVLRTHRWPGNVRELENVIQRACVLTNDETIGVQALPPEMCRKTKDPEDAAVSGMERNRALDGIFDDFSISMPQKIEFLAAKAEKDLIVRALGRCGNRRQAAAELLGISRKSLYNKMVQYGLMDEKMSNESDADV